MFNAGQEIFAITTEKYHGKVIVQIKKGFITDIIQNVENGILNKKYMVSLINGFVTLITEDCVFTNYAQALEASKRLQKEIDNNESAMISSQLDLLFKNKELKNKSLKEGLRWLIEHGFIEVLIK